VSTIVVFLLSCLGVLLAAALERKEQDPRERTRMALLRHMLFSWNA
jgi:hypothetical protein